MREIRIVEDPSVAVAELLLAAVEAGGSIALAGGNTPREAYELAAEADADWSKATLWFGDERCVPADHPFSNFAMVSKAILSQLDPPQRPRVMRIQGELGADIAAANYETELRVELGNSPRFDLVLLGLGPDAHTASLFPGKPTLKEDAHFVAPVPVAGMEPQVPRVTLTLPVINNARYVIFIVKGKEKAEAVARAFGETSSEITPASLVRPTDGNLTVFIDEAAGSCLT